MTINIYTDGAYSSKTKIGGWAVLTIQNDTVIGQMRGWEENTTNNRMELYAVLRAIKEAYTYIPHDNVVTTIYTDSAYISNAFRDRWFDNWRSNGWRTSKKTPVLNQDLWESILYYYEKLPNISIQKVEGHNGNKWNELADQLAVTARTIGAQERSASAT